MDLMFKTAVIYVDWRIYIFVSFVVISDPLDWPLGQRLFVYKNICGLDKVHTLGMFLC